HQVKVFTTVAKLKSFTLAGEQLRVRQPSVSLLVQGLQRELGVRLFERLGNKVRLTRAGEELLKRSEDILAKVEAIREAMDEFKGLKKGKISVGSSGLGTPAYLLASIKTFKEQYGGVDVVLTIQKSEVLQKKLVEGELDVAILGWPPSSNSLVSRPYREEEVVVIVSPDHPLANGEAVPLELVAQEAWIGYEKGSPLRELIEQRFAEKGLSYHPDLEINSEMGSRDAIKSAVESGLGIGFLCKCHVEANVQAGRMKLLNVPELNLKRTTYVATHKNRQTSSLVQVFIEFLGGHQNHQDRQEAQ
ncbi:MAG: LysR family transcriptional regulator, partial [Candidatus Binatia bacterium]